MKKLFLPLLISVIAFFGIANLTPAHADTIGYLCAGGGAGYCVTPSDGDNSLGTNNPFISKPQGCSGCWRLTRTLSTSDCSGHVTATCPFNRGDLNTRWFGQPIYRFKLTSDTAHCMGNIFGGPSTGLAVLQNCNSTNRQQEWVESGGNPDYFVNVWETNGQGVSRVLSDTGSGPFNYVSDECENCETAYHQDYKFIAQ